MRGLRLLLDTVQEIEPAELELKVQRRLEAGELAVRENMDLRRRLSRYEKPDARPEPEPEKSTTLFLRGAEPVEADDDQQVRVVDRRPSQVEMEPAEDLYRDTAAVLVEDMGKLKSEEVTGW